MDPGMAGLAQRDQVAPFMRAAFRKRQLVVDLFRRHDESTIKTKLTEWMLRSVLITDPLPCRTVFFLRGFVPAVFLIAAVHLLLVLRAEASLRQVRTAGIGTGFLRFSWHPSAFFLPRKKPLQISPQRLLYPIPAD